MPSQALEHSPTDGIITARQCMSQVCMKALHLIAKLLTSDACVAQGLSESVSLSFAVSAVLLA
jgi:hypothetical protein